LWWWWGGGIGVCGWGVRGGVVVRGVGGGEGCWWW